MPKASRMLCGSVSRIYRSDRRRSFSFRSTRKISAGMPSTGTRTRSPASRPEPIGTAAAGLVVGGALELVAGATTVWQGTVQIIPGTKGGVAKFGLKISGHDELGIPVAALAKDVTSLNPEILETAAVFN